VGPAGVGSEAWALLGQEGVELAVAARVVLLGVVLDGEQLFVPRRGSVQWTDVGLAEVRHQSMTRRTSQTPPSKLALVTRFPCPGRGHVLAEDVHGAVCLLPVSPGLLLQALPPLTCCLGGELACSAGHGEDAGQPPVGRRAGDHPAL
jgi:hypothetical protein